MRSPTAGKQYRGFGSFKALRRTATRTTQACRKVCQCLIRLSHSQHLSIHSSSVLRIEWCKSRARARRWSEEVTLLLEEMRRVKAFLEWQADWWDQRAQRWSGLERMQEEALAAYAKRQARIRQDMKARFTQQWEHAQRYAEIGVE